MTSFNWFVGVMVFQVLQSGELLIKLQSTSVRICHMIYRSSKSTSSASVLDNLQVCDVCPKFVSTCFLS